MKVDETGSAYTYERALAEVRRHLPKWHQQRAQGLRGDAPDGGRIVGYLEKLFPQDRYGKREGSGVPGGTPITVGSTPGAGSDQDLVPIPGIPGAFAQKTPDGRFVRVK